MFVDIVEGVGAQILLGGSGLWVLLKTWMAFLHWWGSRKDTYHDRLDGWQARIDVGLKEEMARLKAQQAEDGQRIRSLEQMLGRYHKAAVILAADMAAIQPDNPNLEIVRRLLGNAFPPVFVTPADWDNIMDDLDEIEDVEPSPNGAGDEKRV